jgi:hypothetical protein
VVLLQTDPEVLEWILVRGQDVVEIAIDNPINAIEK